MCVQIGGVVAWWPADGNKTDAYGGNNGLEVPEVNYVNRIDNGEVVGHAFDFRKPNEYVEAPP